MSKDVEKEFQKFLQESVGEEDIPKYAGIIIDYFIVMVLIGLSFNIGMRK
jgi:hypothetical protein